MPPYCRGSKHQKNGLAPLEERKRLCDPPNLPNLISFICLFPINMQLLALFLRKEPGGLSSISRSGFPLRFPCLSVCFPPPSRSATPPPPPARETFDTSGSDAPLLKPPGQLLYDEGSHLRRKGAGSEAGIVTQLQGQFVIDPGTAAHQ